MSITYNLNNGLPFFKALSSEIRLKILLFIYQNEGLNIKQIAESFQMPITTLLPHIKTLEECNLIQIIEKSTMHGWEKRCYIGMHFDHIIIDIDSASKPHNIYHMDIPIGSYFDFNIHPTCGLATTSSFIGLLDEPCYFSHPERHQAGILWFTMGYVEYILPCYLPFPASIEEIVLSFEICSECPATNNNWPSDITFSLNDTPLGTWTSPGDFGDKKGKYNPDWWHASLNQYGLLKKLRISPDGTYMDDTKLSSVSTKDLNLTNESILKFRISVLPDARHPGGCTLFGHGFGNHPQNIRGTVKYRNLPHTNSL